MPFDELYQNDTNAALDAMSLRPPAPPESQRSAWGAPWRAVKSAAADVAGSTADILKAYGAASAMTLESDPVARSAIDEQRLREGADEGRRQIATGEAMTSATGQQARNYSRSLRPDPATAGKAEELVFNVVRPVSKLIAGGMVAGPFGLMAAAGEEGLTTSDDLRTQGVDFRTRAAIGTLTAGVTGATAMLPLAGSTLKATAALYVAGGPGSFIAQQAATRAILENANYPELAKQYDPLDPMGLAISSLIPLPFAAHGAIHITARSAAADAIAHDLAAGHAPDGAVDAALTHNLTVQADQQAAIHPLVAGEELAASIAKDRAPRPVPREARSTPEPVAPTDDAAAGPAAAAPSGEARPAAFDQAGLTDTETSPGAVKPDAVQQVVANRVAALQETAGDMPVRVDDAGKAVSVSDEVARIKREVDEGTDTELGHQDADLLRVAAECALSLS